MKKILLLLLMSCKQESIEPSRLFYVRKDWDLDRYSNVTGYPEYPQVQELSVPLSKAVNDTSIVWFTATKLDYTGKASYDDYKVKRKLITTYRRLQ
jgi:hypothetical protein